MTQNHLNAEMCTWCRNFLLGGIGHLIGIIPLRNVQILARWVFAPCYLGGGVWGTLGRVLWRFRGAIVTFPHGQMSSS